MCNVLYSRTADWPICDPVLHFEFNHRDYLQKHDTDLPFIVDLQEKSKNAADSLTSTLKLKVKRHSPTNDGLAYIDTSLARELVSALRCSLRSQYRQYLSKCDWLLLHCTALLIHFDYTASEPSSSIQRVQMFYTAQPVRVPSCLSLAS